MDQILTGKQEKGVLFQKEIYPPVFFLYAFINKSVIRFLMDFLSPVVFKNLCHQNVVFFSHYNNVIMGPMASQITRLTIVYSTVYSGANQRKRQSSMSLAFVRGIHRRPMNSTHKGPVTRKMFPFDDVIMDYSKESCHVYGRQFDTKRNVNVLKGMSI